MRGKGVLYLKDTSRRRITPAYAGKSGNFLPHIVVHQDHPRLCGEKFFAKAFRVSMVGSPPPMRGKVTYSSEFRAYIRITPAYAGKSLRFLTRNQHFQDHPRLCGEKGKQGKSKQNQLGSPPPMRGKGRRVVRRHTGQRITPAYAGKSECLYKNLRVT